MLEKLTDCIIVSLLTLINLYKVGEINYKEFKENSGEKIGFLKNNYEDISKVLEIEHLDNIIHECQLILNLSALKI